MRYIIILLFVFTSIYAKAINGIIVANTANKYIGLKYIWGGNSLDAGVDCSAFIKEIYKQFGYKLPRTAKTQVINTKECPTYTNIDDIEIGDALYFKRNGKIHHTAIVTDRKNGNIIITHAKGKKFGVVEEPMSLYYKKQLYAIKKFYNCTSPLKKEFTNVEIAESIKYVSNKYNIPIKTYFTIMGVESNFKPLVIAIETNSKTATILEKLRETGLKIVLVGKTFHSKNRIVDIYPPDLDTAIFIAKSLKQLGFTFDIGLMQINSVNFSLNDIDKLFYPKENLEKASKILKTCSKIYKTLKLQLECYNRGSKNLSKALNAGLDYAPYYKRYKKYYKEYFKESLNEQ